MHQVIGEEFSFAILARLWALAVCICIDVSF